MNWSPKNKMCKWAKTITPIPDDVIAIIKHARKSLLFYDGTEWIKQSSGSFDVTMGSYDGAEVCELVGLYLLNQIQQSFPQINCGIYRDDGLGTYETMSGPRAERLKKDIFKLFKDNGFKITIDTNMEQSNFLDVTLHLPIRKYWPCRKPNDNPWMCLW